MIDPNPIRNAMRAYYDGIVKPPGHLYTNRSIASKSLVITPLKTGPRPRQRKMNTSQQGHFEYCKRETNSHKLKRTKQEKKGKKKLN